jgi:Double zinc ribbon
MYCPECGAEAGDANFCQECGADLRPSSAATSCPQCGGEAGGANFCPDCGADLKAEAVPRVRRTGDVRRRGGRPRQAPAQRQPQTRQARRRQQPRPQAAPVQRASRGLSPVIIWGGLAAVAVIVVLVIVLAGGHGGAGTANAANGQGVQPVNADTSGSYSELVTRANGLYDQGSAAFQAKKNDQGAAYFAAAAKVYAAAWKQQSADPGVGTDYATSLFYSGQIDAAVRQITKVLAKSPNFQTAWFNKGNYLSEKARRAEQSGDSATAKSGYAAARAAYEKAISLDKASQVGQEAQQSLGQLPQ